MSLVSSQMPYEFQPDPKRKGRNKYLGSWGETECRHISLPFTLESVRQILNWGVQPDAAPFTHQEIAHWCDQMHMEFLDTDADPMLDVAVHIAADVDCQWDLFLANSYTLDQLRELDFSAVRLPTEWFVDWQKELDSEPANAQEPTGGSISNGESLPPLHECE